MVQLLLCLQKCRQHLSIRLGRQFFVQALLLLFLATPFLATAQTKVWDKTFGADNNDNFSAMIPTPDGGYLMGGSSNSGVNGDKTEYLRNGCDEFFCDTDFWVIKVNARGQKVWDKAYGSYGIDELKVIVATPDGGYLLGGTSDSGASDEKSEESRGNTDYWIIKINGTGEKQWDKTFGSDCHEYLQSILITPDGGFMLGGTSESGIGGDKTEASRGADPGSCGNIYSDYWVVKINANGQKVWDKTYGGNDQDIFSAMVAAPDGNFLLGGSSNSGISHEKSQKRIGRTDYWLVKINKNGAKVWDRTIGGTNDDELTALLATPDNNYVLGGKSSSGVSGDKTEASTNDDYWLVQLNGAGTKRWDKTFGGIDQDQLQVLTALPDGGFLVGGSSNSNTSSDKSESSRGGTDYWVIKTNASGNKVWDKTFGGTSDDYLQAMVLSSNNSCLLGGSSVSGTGSDKSGPNKGAASFGRDYWLLKMEVPTKMVQTINFKPVADKTLQDPPFPIAATASSGLPLTYSIVSGPAKIKDNKLVLDGVGTVVVKALQAGNASYSAVESILLFKVNLIPKQWDKTLGANDMERFGTIFPTLDGGYLIGSTSSSGKNGDKSSSNKSKGDFYGCIWLVKINSQGLKEWDQTFGGDFGAQIAAIEATADGGYILGGSSASGIGGDKTDPSEGYSDYWIIKVDADGNKIWDRTIGGPDNDYLATLITTPDGGFLLGGQSASGIGGHKSEDSRGGFFGDYWVVKVDAAGTKVWDKTLGGFEDDDLRALIPTPDGGYLVGGNSFSDVGGDKSQPQKSGCTDFENGCNDYWVIKINANGQPVWDKTIGGPGDDRLQDMVSSPDGGFLLGGTSASGIGSDKSETVNGFNDFWLVKLDDSGNKQWDRTIGGNENDQFASMVSTPDGGYLLGGISGSAAGGDKSEPSLDAWDYWAVKVNATGYKVWDETFSTSEQDLLAKVSKSADGSYLLGGITNAGVNGDKTEVSRGEYDLWLVKLKDEFSVASAWDMRYGGAGTDNFSDAIRTADKGYLVGGYSLSGASGDKSQASQGRADYWIVKTDENGQKLWEKRYGGTHDDYLNRVIQTKDGGYLLAGSSLSGASGDKSQASQGNRDYWVVKTDKNGNLQWEKAFGGTGYDELKKVVQLPTGELVLGGFSNSPVSGNKTQPSQGQLDFWLVKLSATGTKLWDKRYGGNANELLGSFTVTNDGGFLLGGSSLSGKSGDKSQASQGNSDYWVVKTDKNGNLQWEKTFGGSGEEEVYSIGRTETDYFISGTSNSGKSGDKSQNSQGGKDYWLVKINASGDKLWDRTFGGTKDDELRASTFTNEGHFVLAGTSFSAITGDKSQNSRGSSDYWLVAVDQAGNKVYDQRYGGSNAEELRTVFQTRDGGLLLGGRSNSGVSGDRTQPSQGGSDYWLAKVAPITSAILPARKANMLEEPATTQTVTLSAYPNPAQEKSTVSFTLPESQTVTVKVFDSQGREIATLFQGQAQANQKYELDWNANNKAAGLYILQLQTPTSRHQHKLLLSK